MTQTDSTLVRKPTVYFPTDGANLELRLFRVDPKHLELVEIPPNTDIPPSLTDGTDGTADVVTSVADGSDRLSQSEMDNLFD